MSSPPKFHCHICNHRIQNPYLSIERRVEKVSVVNRDGSRVTTINIADCQVMSMYCSSECWQKHQPEIAVALELQVTFPAFNFVTPCCRRGKVVNRTQHYVSRATASRKWRWRAAMSSSAIALLATISPCSAGTAKSRT